MNEIWKTISGFEDYKVSSEGRIMSVERIYFNGRGMQKTHNKLMKPSLDPKGYYRVVLRRNGTSVTCKVHRLVAITFIPNPEGKPEVNHLDENSQNNCVNNLAWVTHQENMRYGTKGIRQSKKISVPIIQFELSGKLLRHFSSTKIASQITGIPRSSIWSNLSGRSATAHGYIFKYEREVMNNVDSSKKRTKTNR